MHSPVGSDPRATSNRYRDRKIALRRLLRVRYGWPGARRRAGPAHYNAVVREADALIAARGSQRPSAAEPEPNLAEPVADAVEQAGLSLDDLVRIARLDTHDPAQDPMSGRAVIAPCDLADVLRVVPRRQRATGDLEGLWLGRG